MTPETKHFLCRNNACAGGNIGGAIIEYQETKENFYQCPHCGQRYLILKDGTIVAFFDEIIFDSFSSCNEFQDQFYSKELYINKLVIRGISDNENFISTIAFRKCWFDEVYIESTDIETTCYPIAFDDCTIDRFYIRDNARISHKNRYDFWSPYHFFGINIIRTGIKEIFEISDMNSSLCIIDSIIACPLNIQDSVIDDLVLVNNNPDFTVAADKNSTIFKNVAVIDQTAPVKDFTAEAGKSNAGRKIIEEIIIDPDATGVLFLSDAEVKNIVFPEDATVNARLIFNNCLIHNLQNQSRAFKRDLVFKTCRFLSDMEFSRIDFEGDLVFEGCVFEEEFALDVLHVNKDLHLSYSLFKNDVDISQVTVGNYFITHFSRYAGMFALDRIDVKRNLTIGSFIFEKVLKISLCEVGGDLFIKRGHSQGSIQLDNLQAGNLTVAEILINKDLSITFTEVRGDITFESFEILGGFGEHGVNFLKSNRFRFIKMTSRGELNLFNLDANMLFIISSTFKKDLNFYTPRISDRTSIQDNLFADSLRLDNMTAGDINISKNKILNCLWLTNNELDDLVVEDFDIRQLEITAGVYGSITVRKGEVWHFTLNDLISRKSVLIKDQKILHSAEVLNNRFDFNLAIQGRSFETPFYLDNNQISGKLELGGMDQSEGYNGEYFKKPVSISNNRIGSATFIQTTFHSSACMNNNYFEGNVNIYDGFFEKGLDFSDNYIGGTIIFNSTFLKDVLILDHAFLDKRMSFVNSQIIEYSFFDATLNGFSIPGNWKIIGGKLRHAEKVFKEIPQDTNQADSGEKAPDTVSENGGNNPDTGNQKKERVKYILADENLESKIKTDKTPITYNIIKKYVLEKKNFLKRALDSWSDLQCLVFIYEENLEKIKTSFEVGEKIIAYREMIEKILSREYLTVYYGFHDEDVINDLKNVSAYFYSEERSFEDEDVNELYGKLKEFFVGFAFCLEHFHKKTIFFDFVDKKEAEKNLKADLYERLQDQYLVIRGVFGDSGELGNEDRAYYQWMHNRNMYDKEKAKWSKPVYRMKQVIFEWMFGWGVNLYRILLSTVIMMFIFSFIYQFIFIQNPDLSIKYDEVMVPAADITYPRTLFLSLSTTFSAFMGDWAPIGSGPIKVLMTIHSILGVLFVTFMVAAFGRKMLR
ncbi:MAG: hypothetical protein GXO86_13840 [Chlorobi bacterium]|nr:hypothetical protein [Chlorobiota bacterium]